MKMKKAMDVAMAAAKVQLRRALRMESQAVVPRVSCPLCKAAKGWPCLTSGGWMFGRKTRPHAERRAKAAQIGHDRSGKNR